MGCKPFSSLYTIASAVTNLIYTFLLVPTDLTYLNTIVFILVIAALIIRRNGIKESMPALYESLGVFLPLIATNCAVLVSINKRTERLLCSSPA